MGASTDDRGSDPGSPAPKRDPKERGRRLLAALGREPHQPNLVAEIDRHSVDYREILKAVLSVDGLSGDVQLHKNHDDGRDQLIVTVETDRSATEYEKLAFLLYRADA